MDERAVKPAIVVDDAPKLIAVEPTVILELVKDALGIFVAPIDTESAPAFTNTVTPVPATKVKVS